MDYSILADTKRLYVPIPEASATTVGRPGIDNALLSYSEAASASPPVAFSEEALLVQGEELSFTYSPPSIFLSAEQQRKAQRKATPSYGENKAAGHEDGRSIPLKRNDNDRAALTHADRVLEQYNALNAEKNGLIFKSGLARLDLRDRNALLAEAKALKYTALPSLMRQYEAIKQSPEFLSFLENLTVSVAQKSAAHLSQDEPIPLPAHITDSQKDPLLKRTHARPEESLLQDAIPFP